MSASTDDVIALVSVGKSLLAELTSVVALLSIFLTCASRLLRPLSLEAAINPLSDRRPQRTAKYD